MLFNSIPFLLLFFVTYIIYWSSPDRWKKPILIVASIIFYSYNSLPITFHFLAVIVINYYFSQKLKDQVEAGLPAKPLLVTIVSLNLVNLGFFKYFYFITNSIYTITGLVSVKDFSIGMKIYLPLAISFYTFQLLAIQIDTYRGKLENRIKFTDYLLFILFFPQLIAGPIMRTQDFIPQINSPSIDDDRMKRGILLILTGLFKKAIIADNLGPIIAPLYVNPTDYDAFSLFIGVFGFSSQVYCDFSGYSDIARGLANLMGFEIPANFRGPFMSTNFTEYWTRWHITLSTWLRDYLYISLGGNRKGANRANLNMLVTMTLGGLWHGANINYILWGFYLGLGLWIERILEALGLTIKSTNFMVRVFKIWFVYFLFSISGVFFRAGAAGDKSIEIAYKYLSGMFSLNAGKELYRLEEMGFFILITLFLNFIEYKPESLERWKRFRNIWIPVYSVIMLLLLGIFGDGGGDFIYFQF
ncbi:MAG: MBOAT family protein [Leptospiraceae bacterium]|nr:MBOAT family protein [Leptospiraceae bacterium]